MPRQRRLEIIGMIYHIISRGIERRKIFRDNKDKNEFINRLNKSLKLTKTQCYAWVLMDNHFHLLLRPLKEPLSVLMRQLLSGYVGYFNARHTRVGHLFQNRYKSILCQEDILPVQPGCGRSRGRSGFGPPPRSLPDERPVPHTSLSAS